MNEFPERLGKAASRSITAAITKAMPLLDARCPECGGAGIDPAGLECPTCEGWGMNELTDEAPEEGEEVEGPT